jgi:benzoate membrane transport protein
VVGYAGPALIVLSASQSGHLTSAQTTSWLWAISIGSGGLTFLLSGWLRQPILISWSTPGAALLVASLERYPYAEAIGAYVLVAVATIVVGWTGWFGAVVRRIPPALVSAMLAGVLLPFGIRACATLGTNALVPAVVFGAFFVGRRFTEQLAIPAAVIAGVAAAAATSQLHLSAVNWQLARPQLTTPAWSWAAVVGLAIPLFIVTMTAQNAAGLAVLSTHGYRTRDRVLVTAAGWASLLVAPFGGHAVNMSAITAEICAGPSCDRDPARRYVAGFSAGLSYLVVGTFAAGLVAIFTQLPAQLVAAVAGVALLGAMTSSLASSLAPGPHRQAALVTLLVTLSGISGAGLGAAVWGLGLGLLVLFLTGWRIDGWSVDMRRWRHVPAAEPPVCG